MKVKLLKDYPLHRDRKSKQKYEQRQCSISPLIAPPSKKKKIAWIIESQQFTKQKSLDEEIIWFINNFARLEFYSVWNKITIDDDEFSIESRRKIDETLAEIRETVTSLTRLQVYRSRDRSIERYRPAGKVLNQGISRINALLHLAAIRSDESSRRQDYSVTATTYNQNTRNRVSDLIPLNG